MGVLIMKKSYDYLKLDKEDPEEVMHRRAQFLIYSALERADSRRKSSFSKIRLCKLKIKIGRKLKRLRKSMFPSISAARARTYKQIINQLKGLFSSGDAVAI